MCDCAAELNYKINYKIRETRRLLESFMYIDLFGQETFWCDVKR